MSHRATGPFEVKVVPQKPDTQIARAANLGRLTIDKRFHGELEAISKGEMLATHTEVQGSAAYVALERVTGTLKGRTGSFVLQHSATMIRGKPADSVTVVPDSGTGELKGISGKMNLTIASDSAHSYEFDYLDEPEEWCAPVALSAAARSRRVRPGRCAGRVPCGWPTRPPGNTR